MIRRGIDRAFGLVALLLVRGFHRTLDSDDVHHLRTPGPKLVVANHFNGFMDVAVLVAAMGKLPRFVAKATLRDVVVARPLLRLAGVVLVQRSQDGRGTGGNVDAFAACHERLRQGDTVVIFPEGTTHERETLSEMRTGAARIAIGARAAGASDLRIVPVGLSFGDKVRYRNDVLVAVGRPLAVPDGAPDDHDLVDALTATIGSALGALVPGVDDPVEAWEYDRAAEVYLRTRGEPEPPLAERQAVARRVARASADARTEALRALGRYTLALDLNRLDDRDVSGVAEPIVVRAVLLGVLTWFALPVLAPVALVSGPALALVLVVDSFVKVPVTKGTVRVLVSVVAFPTAWVVGASVTVDGGWAIFGLVLLQAVLLVGGLFLMEADVHAVRRLFDRRAAVLAAARIPALRQRRDRLVAAVGAAVTPRTAAPPAEPRAGGTATPGPA